MLKFYGISKCNNVTGGSPSQMLGSSGGRF